MNYFEKIEAYKSGNLNEVERLVFEETLVQNASLQQELAAYELGQDLFDFVGMTLSEETITAPEAEETADFLINFTADNLSEAQILAPVSTITKTPIIHQLQPRRNRSAWLVAASMLFIVSWVGTRFFSIQAAGEAENLVAEKVIEPIKTNTVKTIASIEAPKEVIITRPKVILQKKKYLPAKARTNNEIIQPTVKEQFAVTTTNAKEITTGATMQKGQPINYTATESITLTPGFVVNSGTDFSAVTKATITPEEVTSNTVISEKETVVFKAGSTITLEPGFHAKAGAGFVATIEGK